MNKVIIIVLIGLFACSDKEKPDLNFKVHRLESIGPTDYDIEFKFPKSIVSVRDFEDYSRWDTTNVFLVWLANEQFDHPENFYFYDSLELSNEVAIRITAGPRVRISDKIPDSYHAVPRMSLTRIFPQESENRKIVYDWRNKKFKDKTYHKRKYEVIEDSVKRFQYFYYIETIYQSTMVIVNSKVDNINMDKYFLEYFAVPKKKD